MPFMIAIWRGDVGGRGHSSREQGWQAGRVLDSDPRFHHRDRLGVRQSKGGQPKVEPERLPMPRRTVLMPLLLAGMGLTTLLTGCQADVEAELEIGDIRERETHGLFATSKVRTEDCDRGSRSAEREGSAGWATWVLSGVFPDTRYRGCRELEAGAETTFRNMIVFDANPGETLSGLSHVNIKLHEQTLSVGLPPYVQGNIERVRDQAGLEGQPEITSRLTLINNEDQAFGYRQAHYGAHADVGVDDGEWGELHVLEPNARVSLDYPAGLAERVFADGRAPLLRIEPVAH
ncbi:hypothetical protein [Guyparkeria sp. TX1]|uniref:hypothetical protein n=1 Tax=Guyparkeria sp. TX1 TaxID=3115001 RepID=UPI0039779390